MPNSQLLICTAIPRAFSIDPATVAVSVLVSPRLRGDNKLGSYPDWLNWTELRQQHGFRVEFVCNGATRVVDMPVANLRPDVWHALFNAQTFVRSHTFDDYSSRFVSSYPVRLAAAGVQATYQTAAVQFALPSTDGAEGGRGPHRRALFNRLMEGWAMQWSEDAGRAWRKRQIGEQRAQSARLSSIAASQLRGFQGLVSEDGLLGTGALDRSSPEFAAAQQDVVQRFGVFSHVPAGAPVTAASLDEDHVLDFHQALSSLNAYPELLHLLGLVFDVELPLDFVVPTSGLTPGQLSIIAVDGNWNADVATTVPPTSTAYVRTELSGLRFFAVAPRAFLEQGRPLSALGLLSLDPTRYGVMQLDIDGAMHKTVMLADTITQSAGEAPAQHPEVFDPTTTLSSLRSGGFSLFADARALALLDTAERSKAFNEAYEGTGPSPGPLCAEDLTRGYRLDIWDSHTQAWHSLHHKHTTLAIGDPPIQLVLEDSEGFFQLAATQASPAADGTRPNNDLYLHEAMVRWSGWSLSADTIGKHLTRAADPDKAVPDPNNPDPENQPVTPFKLTARNTVVAGTLPRLRFGVGYRLRVRALDLAGNGLGAQDPETKVLTAAFSLPRGDGVVPYLRFEPVVAPTILLRDVRGLTGPGSSLNRLVIRTFNTDPSLDTAAADVTASDRHIAPPRATVEMAERHGMFDDPSGNLVATPAMWQLIKERDAGDFNHVVVDSIVINGEKQSVPLEPDAMIPALPYLPDPLARAAALRDLPGSTPAAVGREQPGLGGEHAVGYDVVVDARPLPGSVTIVEFGGREDWQAVAPFRFALADGDAAPHWDPQNRVLTVSLPKGTTHVLPVTSCPDPADLKCLGVWKWLKDYVELVATHQLDSEFFDEIDKDRIAHVLALAAEGGHGMLTPSHVLTLVHAVQQPIGRPQFTRLTAQFPPAQTDGLATQPESAPTAETELAVLQAWRHLGDTDAWLVGALEVHAPSTAKLDIRAEWTDPVDDVTAPAPGEQSFSAPVDELALPTTAGGYLPAKGNGYTVGYLDAAQRLICLAPDGSALGELKSGIVLGTDAMPIHRIGDSRHHVVNYTAVATSRYREYFPPQDGPADRDFTRSGDPVVVHVPASSRPVAPEVLYVVPTFGWERETRSDQVRSVRLGGGLRVYLERPWYSSGAGELLGIALASAWDLDREDWKPFITQWGQDPIWESAPLQEFPSTFDFPDAIARERDLSLDARIRATGLDRRVDVAGHEVHFDADRKLWYCDLTVDPHTATYAPFVRLALVRYQPHALVDAKLSRVVLADFSQLTPERAVTVTADLGQRGTMQVVVSGPAPRGPVPASRATDPGARPTRVTVSVQQHAGSLASDLAWSDAGEFVVDGASRDTTSLDPDFILWTGTVRYTGQIENLQPGRYRLLIREHEILQSDGSPRPIVQQRLIYAETLPLDDPLLAAPALSAAHTDVTP